MGVFDKMLSAMKLGDEDYDDVGDYDDGGDDGGDYDDGGDDE